MKRKVAILLIFIFLFQFCMLVYAAPPTSLGEPESYEDVEAGEIFQGKNPYGYYYNSNEVEFYNDYYRSIMNKGKYRNKDTGAALTNNHFPIASFSWSINTTSPDVKRATGTTSNSKVLDLGTIYLGDTITFTDKSTNGSAAAGNLIQSIYLNVAIRQDGYNYNTGSLLSIAPKGSVSYTADKPGIYLVTMQSKSGPYYAWFQSQSGKIVPSEIWSVNGAHHAWGEKMFGDEYWSGWSHFVGVTFRVKEKDTKTPIADMTFSDTDDMIKFIYSGENVTIIDKSYTREPGKEIIKWLVEIKANVNGTSKVILPKQWITNPYEFFKTYNFPEAGTYEFTLYQVEQN